MKRSLTLISIVFLGSIAFGNGETISPNMNLIIPTPGVTTGPAYANDLNSSLLIIDQHNHTSGNGSQIPPAGLNINSALTFQNSPAINLQCTAFTPQASLATANALYVSGVDLYFNDGAGDPPIRVTSGGSVNATSSGITGSGGATAGFSSGVLVVDSATNTPANIQAGSILIGNNVSGSNFVTLQPQNSLGSSYSLTLPTVPSSQKIMTLDASGNMSAPYTVDGSTIAISANIIGVPSGSLTTTQLSSSAGIIGTQLSSSAGIIGTQLSVSAAIAGSQLASAANINVSQLANTLSTFGSDSGSYSNSTGTSSTICGATSPSLIAQHEVRIYIQPTAASGTNGFIATSGTGTMAYRIQIAGVTIFTGILPALTSNLVFHYQNAFTVGSAAYTFQAAVISGSGTITAQGMQMIISQGS